MDYANQYQAGAANQFQGAGLGSINKGTEAPRTIASAASRIDDLNSRLSKATEGLSMISSQLGALTPISADPAKNGATSASGAVYRLNDAADVAHNRLMEIESLIGGIARALG